MPGLHAGGLGQAGEQAPGLGDNGVGVHAALLQHRPDDAFFFFGQGDQQVQREHHLAFVLFGDGLGLLQGFLRFLSQFVQCETYRSPMSNTKRAGEPAGSGLPSSFGRRLQLPPVYMMRRSKVRCVTR